MIYVSAILLAVSTRVSAADSSPAYNFLNLSTSSRICGLGGVNISTVSDEITSTEQNPALLGPEFHKQLAVGYMRYIGESNLASARFGMAAGERGAWMAHITYFGYGSMKEADVTGTVTGSISPKDINFGAGYSHSLSEHWRGGFDIKFLYSAYGEYNAFAMATDLGVNYYDPERDLSFSAVIANLGGQIKRFENSYDRLPVDLRLGWSQSFGSFPVRFSVTAWNLTKWHLPYFEAGDGSDNSKPKKIDKFGSNLFRHLIFAADIIPSDKFNLGIGYNYKTRTDLSTYKRNFLSGFSVCGGINIRSFAVGVAFAQPHTGATTLLFNLAVTL